ncbi:MAG: PepSY domain-containing protein [Burkholderiales bacterium]|nr:PepSY domain-containing protein [Burkholderiales bacterium]
MKTTTFPSPRSNPLAALALAAALLGIATGAQAYSGQSLAGQAKVTLSEARAIALKAHPGKIAAEELEKEAGGSGLRYSFDIRNGKSTQEVGVDAQTGKVLEDKTEGAHPD